MRRIRELVRDWSDDQSIDDWFPLLLVIGAITAFGVMWAWAEYANP
jgi:hypothetical protein